MAVMQVLLDLLDGAVSGPVSEISAEHVRSSRIGGQRR